MDPAQDARKLADEERYFDASDGSRTAVLQPFVEGAACDLRLRSPRADGFFDQFVVLAVGDCEMDAATQAAPGYPGAWAWVGGWVPRHSI
jgi:hypothetical protein